MVDFRELVPEMQRKAVHCTQFVESLAKCNKALSDVAVMSQSYFKRPWAANRLKTARECLNDATTDFAHSCPPPMVSMGTMKMLLDRRVRTGTSATSISIFGAHAPSWGQNQGGRLGTKNLLTIESRLPTSESLSDRTQAEVENLVLEGQALLGQLPDGMSGALAGAIRDGGSPIATVLRQRLPTQPESVGTIDSAKVQGLEVLEKEDATLLASLPNELAHDVVASVIRSNSPVADVVCVHIFVHGFWDDFCAWLLWMIFVHDCVDCVPLSAPWDVRQMECRCACMTFVCTCMLTDKTQ